MSHTHMYVMCNSATIQKLKHLCGFKIMLETTNNLILHVTENFLFVPDVWIWHLFGKYNIYHVIYFMSFVKWYTVVTPTFGQNVLLIEQNNKNYF
jgi:hypothetical protein